MAIESSFNPFAQSSVGAQGLMQVMTQASTTTSTRPSAAVHAAFDPVTNLRVGVQVLKECIARAGSLEAGLRSYVGAANSGDDGGYAGKVLAEQDNLRQVASGGKVPRRPVHATLPAPKTRRLPSMPRHRRPPSERQRPAGRPAPAPDKVALRTTRAATLAPHTAPTRPPLH